MTPLRVAVAQPRTVVGDVRANVAVHAQAVRSADARLVVFPELSLTGYDLPPVSVDPHDLAPLVRACAETASLALIGAPVAGPSLGVLLVTGEGVDVVYRKMSLGDPETECFTPGTGPAVIEVGGWRVGLGVCKDTRIAEHLDATAGLGIDLYVAGLVHAPSERAELDERARRITTTYDVPVAFAACAGPTGGGYDETSGGSSVWSAEGELLATAGPEPGGIAVAEIAPGSRTAAQGSRL